MKRFTLALAALLPLLAAGAAFGQTTPPAKNVGRIASSLHNFSDKGWSGNQICQPCHTPHNSIAADVSKDLWAHTLSTSSYTVAGGDVLTQEDALDPYSRLCMSCHDGTVALDAFIGGAGVNGPMAADSQFNMGTDLSNDHPIGNEAVYNGDSSSYNSTTTNSRGSTVVGVNDPATGKAQLTLRPSGLNATDKVVSCGTCHNPHGAGNTTATYPKLLRMTNQGSQMCLTCHIK